MKQTKLNRRTFLRGSSVAMALPFLEIMMSDKAYAAGGPARFVYMFQGQSLGPDLQNTNFFIPTTTGSNYTLSYGLSPLATHGVKGDVSVVTGLKIPFSGPGRRDPAATFHSLSHFPQLLGTRSNGSAGALGEGADQIMAKVLGAGAKLKSLETLGQPYMYHGEISDGVRNIATYSRNAAGQILPVVPEVSPLKTFQSLFTTGSVPIDRRKSVLDFVLAQRNSLLNILGSADRSRLSDHFDQVRDLERTVASVSSCGSATSPGADPAMNLATSSGETVRNRAFMDIIHLALACDLTRVVHHMFTQAHCFLATSEIGGVIGGINTDVHEMGHFGGGNFPAVPAGTPFYTVGTEAAKTTTAFYAYNMSTAHAWAVNNFAYLVKKLKATPEGAGTLLDNCVLLMGFEGGHGGEFEADATLISQMTSHSTQNMAMLIAGNAGGLKHGRHISAPGVHPGQVTIAGMKAAGGPSVLGELSGGLSQLFS